MKKVLVTEEQHKGILKENFDPEETKNLIGMLMSPDDSNVELALAMIEGRGMNVVKFLLTHFPRNKALPDGIFRSLPEETAVKIIKLYPMSDQAFIDNFDNEILMGAYLSTGKMLSGGQLHFLWKNKWKNINVYTYTKGRIQNLMKVSQTEGEVPTYFFDESEFDLFTKKQFEFLGKNGVRLNWQILSDLDWEHAGLLNAYIGGFLEEHENLEGYEHLLRYFTIDQLVDYVDDINTDMEALEQVFQNEDLREDYIKMRTSGGEKLTSEEMDIIYKYNPTAVHSFLKRRLASGEELTSDENHFLLEFEDLEQFYKG